MFGTIPGLPQGFEVKGFKVYWQGTQLELMLLRASNGTETRRYKVKWTKDTREIESLTQISVKQYRRLMEGAVKCPG